MDQNIKLKIAGREFPLKAASPEMERLMRLAAEDISKMMARYDEKYPDKDFSEKLLFVTLTETVGKISAQGKINAISAEGESLQAELRSYLERIENNR